jgi:HlyD family secretion protein
MKKKYIILAFVLLGVTAAVSWYFLGKEKLQPVNFITAIATPGYIAKSITATGTVEPLDTVTVGAQVSGVVKRVLVDFNSMVKKGQLLAEIDASILRAQEDAAKANLASAKSNFDFQASNFAMQSRLFDEKVISKSEYLLSTNQYRDAEASVDNAEAQLRVIQKTLSYTNIYSPVNGVVLNRNVSAGQTIASSFNAPVLFVIAKDLTRMQVDAAVDEADIGGVKTGQNASFTVDAFPNDIFTGTVREILLHPSVSANVVTYRTLINVDNTSMKLKPGMTASINIYIQEDSSALLIPSRALSFKPDSSLVSRFKIIRAVRDTAGRAKTHSKNRLNQRETNSQTSNENADTRKSFIWQKAGDTLRERKIITALNDDAYVQVINGLSPGEEVITNVSANGNKDAPGTTPRSPFIPQMQRRTATPPRN